MARIHGKKGALYAAITSAGTAEPIAFLTDWSLDQSTDKVDVTAFQDANKVYASGTPDAQGSFSGFYDDATAQIFTAAVDGVARKLYLYPDTTTPAKYWYGTAFFDAQIQVSNSDAAKISGTFVPASTITKMG